MCNKPVIVAVPNDKTVHDFENCSHAVPTCFKNFRMTFDLLGIKMSII